MPGRRSVKFAQSIRMRTRHTAACRALLAGHEAADAKLNRNFNLSFSLLAQGAAAPLVATGLLQHESRLSVLNFAIRKAAGFEAPLPNKAPLLFVTGLRCAF